MSGKKGKFRIKRAVQFVLIPLVFTAIGIGLLYGASQAFLSDGMVFFEVLFADAERTPQKSEVGSIFYGVPTNDEHQTDAAGETYVPLASVEMPTYETEYGKIEIPSAGISCPLIYGDSDLALSVGAGQYIGSKLIGFGGTTLVAGHANTCFERLPAVQVGDMITVTTFYGVYQYRVTNCCVGMPNDKTMYDLAREDENLVCYTCYYTTSELGNVKKRFFVQADYVSGPLVK